MHFGVGIGVEIVDDSFTKVVSVIVSFIVVLFVSIVVALVASDVTIDVMIDVMSVGISGIVPFVTSVVEIVGSTVVTVIGIVFDVSVISLAFVMVESEDIISVDDSCVLVMHFCVVNGVDRIVGGIGGLVKCVGICVVGIVVVLSAVVVSDDEIDFVDDTPFVKFPKDVVGDNVVLIVEILLFELIVVPVEIVITFISFRSLQLVHACIIIL